MSFPKISRLTILVLGVLAFLVDAQTCYWPNGAIAAQFNACNSTTGGAASACCGPDSICTTSGYCTGSAYYHFRGACTDKTWGSPNCPQECQNVADDTFANIVPCGPSGLFNTEFCCSEGLGSSSCCSNTFKNVLGTPYALSGTDFVQSSTPSASANASASPAAATNTSTAKSTPQASHTASSDSAVAIGVGIGVPLGVLLLASLGFLYYRERRRRVGVERSMRNGYGAAGWEHSRDVKDVHGSQSFTMDEYPHELGQPQRGPEELESRELYRNSSQS